MAFTPKETKNWGGLALVILASFALWLGGFFSSYSTPEFVTSYYEAVATGFTFIGILIFAAYALKVVVRVYKEAFGNDYD